MITRDGKLEVFENFHRDTRLPKFAPKDPPKKFEDFRVRDSDDLTRLRQEGTLIFNSSASTAVTDWGGSSNIVMMANPRDSSMMVSESDQDEIVKAPKTTKKWWGRFVQKKPKEPVYGPPLTIQEFFKTIKNSTEELNVVRTRAAGYEQAMKTALENGQTALVEKLVAGLHAAKMECQLEAIGLPRYLEEESVVQFVRQSTKKLDLTWMKNFTRIIPARVIDKKKIADEHSIFDNYAILHYDPEGISKADTKEEVARKKDPILFGLIEDRRRLYFLGDWEDEFCNLTLDRVADEIGEAAIKNLENDKPV